MPTEAENICCQEIEPVTLIMLWLNALMYITYRDFAVVHQNASYMLRMRSKHHVRNGDMRRHDARLWSERGFFGMIEHNK